MSFLPSELFTKPLACIDTLFQAAIARDGGAVPGLDDDFGVGEAFIGPIASYSDKVTFFALFSRRFPY